MDSSSAETSVSLKLEEIKRRCSELMDEPDGLSGLTLEDAAADPGVNDPYNCHTRLDL
jgi:hypothetical protein